MRYYIEPTVELLYLANEDILTVSGDDSDLWGDDIFDVLQNG